MQEFFEYKMKSGISMATYIIDLKNIVFKLKSLGEGISDAMVISKILKSLPENYKCFVSAWESTPLSERTLINLSARLLAEEVRNKQDSKETVTFRAAERKCYECGMKGHFADTCRKEDAGKGDHCARGNNYRRNNKSTREYGKNSMKICRICGKHNHNERNCYFRKKRDSTTKEENNNNNKIAFLANSNTQEEGSWIIDSGSTSHMVNDETVLEKVDQATTRIGLADKKANMVSEKKGEVDLGHCELKNVLYIPNLIFYL